MPSFLSTPRFVFTWVIAAGLLLSSCDAPVKTPNPPEPEQKPTEAVKVPAAPSSPSAEPEAPASAPTSEPPQPEIPTVPTLEIREEGNKIVVKGWLSSRYQAQDIINGLTSSFPDAEVINELQTDPGVTEVGWGNRVLELVVPLLGGTTDARFFYEKGITYLEGTVVDARLINEFQKMTTYVMSDIDSKGITNRLKVKGQEEKLGTSPGPKKGK